MTKKGKYWIPAFAGMTDRGMDAGLHRYDGQWGHAGMTVCENRKG
jgi:hypothetical protein